MNFRKNEKGAIIIEAAVVIPLLLVLMTLMLYLINIFVVQTYIQYALNQTVNELGNYTTYLNYLGVIDVSNSVNSELSQASIKAQDNWTTVTDAFEAIQENLTGQSGENSTNASSINWNKLLSTAGSAQEIADVVIEYKNKPFSLLKQLLSGPLISAADGVHQYLGGLLGKMMMYKYADDDFLVGCGVVSYDYNGYETKAYEKGIAGIDFTRSVFLGNSDSRVIDVVAVYRIKYPVNIARFVHAPQGSVLYDNSICIVQRAAGYGWINGDGKGSPKYNGSEKKGLRAAF